MLLSLLLPLGAQAQNLYTLSWDSVPAASWYLVCVDTIYPTNPAACYGTFVYSAKTTADIDLDISAPGSKRVYLRVSAVGYFPGVYGAVYSLYSLPVDYNYGLTPPVVVCH